MVIIQSGYRANSISHWCTLFEGQLLICHPLGRGGLEITEKSGQTSKERNGPPPVCSISPGLLLEFHCRIEAGGTCSPRIIVLSPRRCVARDNRFPVLVQTFLISHVQEYFRDPAHMNEPTKWWCYLQEKQLSRYGIFCITRDIININPHSS